MAPALNKIGLDTLAVDQRSGGTMWGHRNRTVVKLGKSTGYLEVLVDLQAAVNWAATNKYKTIIAVGSCAEIATLFETMAKANERIVMGFEDKSMEDIGAGMDDIVCLERDIRRLNGKLPPRQWLTFEEVRGFYAAGYEYQTENPAVLPYARKHWRFDSDESAATKVGDAHSTNARLAGIQYPSAGFDGASDFDP